MNEQEFRQAAIETLREHKKTNKLTLEQLGLAVDSDASTMHYILSRKREARIESFVKWLGALGYRVDFNINKITTGTCEIRWCMTPDVRLIYVDEIIGDSAYRVCICQRCADAIGVDAGGVLPEPEQVRRALRKINGRQQQRA